MERIEFYPCKKGERTRVKFRLRDGRNIQIYHTTDILCDAKDLAKLNPDGTTKDRIKIFDAKLAEQLKEEYVIMTEAFAIMRDKGLDPTTAVWEQEITRIKNPIQQTREENPDIVSRFKKYTDNAHRDGLICDARHRHITVVCDKLHRFLIINGISGITAQDFSVEHLMEFRNFLFNEYNYVDQYPKLYEKVSERNKPKSQLSMNTVASQMKMLQAFFMELENTDEIQKSPFRRLGREKRRTVMRTQYDEPFFLRREELLQIINKNVPKELQSTKDAFLVQCAFGCRVNDFQRLSLKSISVSDEGIPYIHYLPSKTLDSQSDNMEIKTPIVRFAFDIIMRTGFNFPILKNLYGTDGYNARIKYLLHVCKIEREVAQFNEGTKSNEYVPLFKVGSSKLCRKTHVDLMQKVQLDPYLSGLHKRGSSAVNRYTALEIKDRFELMNRAFNQKAYTVAQDLTIN